MEGLRDIEISSNTKYSVKLFLDQVHTERSRIISSIKPIGLKNGLLSYICFYIVQKCNGTIRHANFTKLGKIARRGSLEMAVRNY